MSRFLTYTAVYGILEREGRVFVLRRANTGYQDGRFTLPAGHVEEGETPVEAVVRELAEEAGVKVSPADAEFVHVLYRMQPDRTYHDYFFRFTNWEGEPYNAETARADAGHWAVAGELDGKTVPGLDMALAKIALGDAFSEEKFQ